MAEIAVSDWEALNVVLNRLFRRSLKSATGLLSPEIISMCKGVISEDGIIGQVLIPIDGTLTKVSIYVPGVNKDKQPSVNVELLGPDGITVSTTLKLTKEKLVGDIVQEIVAQSILTVRLSDTSFTNVLVSAVFLPTVGAFKAAKYLHDAIESAADEGIREAANKVVLTGITDGRSSTEE